MRTVGRMLGFLRPYPGRLILFGLAALLASAFTASPIIIVQKWFEVVFDTLDFRRLCEVCGLLLAVILLGAFFDYWRRYLGAYLAGRVFTDANNRLARKLLSLSLPFFDRTRTGELLSRLSVDSIALYGTVFLVTRAVHDAIMVFVVTGMILYLNWKLALIGLFGIVFALGPLVYLGKKIQAASRRWRETHAVRVDQMAQCYSGMRIVKGYGQEDQEAESQQTVNAHLFNYRMRQARAAGLSEALFLFFVSLGIGAVVFTGGLLVIEGHIEGKELMSFLVAMAFLRDPARRLAGLHNQIREVLPGAGRVFELLDQKAEVADAPDAVEVDGFREKIAFRNASFSYGREEILSGIDLEVRAGETIGVVGESGAGKSSLVNLLCRFYDPTAGSVEIDGVDLRQVKQDSFRRQIALVTQDPFLFNTTARENIRYGRPAASDEEVEEAARAANIHDDILGFPQGYETLVGERGLQVSGGQRQRIAIARALLRNAPLLVLDEATSSLDSVSEKLVQEAIERLVAGRTTLVIAHRISTLRNADRILVLADGRIEAVAPHDELLAKSPTYRRLLAAQEMKRDPAAPADPADPADPAAGDDGGQEST